MVGRNAKIGLFCPVHDASLGQIIGSHFHHHLVTGENAYVVLAHFSGYMRGNDMSIVEFNAKHSIGQGVNDGPFHFDLVFFCHNTLS